MISKITADQDFERRSFFFGRVFWDKKDPNPFFTKTGKMDSITKETK
jgi:hypothetical protein